MTKHRKQTKPLGHIMLESGPKEITVMNDMFTNYHFSKKEFWEDLRSMANIFISDYAQGYPCTALRPIEGEIIVETQYEKFKEHDIKLKRQDFKLMGGEATYMELQNKAYPEMPIEEQAIEYYGLGIASDGKQISNQMWLMAENLPKLMHGKKYVNYVLKDEASNIPYPKTSGIMFASLKQLSEEGTPAGELSSLLLGKKIDPDDFKSKNVRAIAEGFNKGFGFFKEDKEVVGMMTVREKWTLADRIEAKIEGRIEGRIEGKIEVCYKDLKMSPKEIAALLGMDENSVSEILAKLKLPS